MKPLATNSGAGAVDESIQYARVVALEHVDHRPRVGVVVRLAGVGARDPARDVGLAGRAPGGARYPIGRPCTNGSPTG